jgi:EAL domain-containing protein (putative c-di-GMP-specific phosphodiesterase class I)
MNPHTDIEGYVAALPESVDAATPFYRIDGAQVAGCFHEACVSSVFQPSVDLAQQSIVGHQGLLRIVGSGDAAPAPWNLFSRAASDAALRQLDRLCRTLHALNYFSQADADKLLFLNVEQRLLATVPDNHGTVFKGTLAKLGLTTAGIVIMFPRVVVEYPWWLERAARNYRSHGYRVLVPASCWDYGTLRLFEDMPVDFVKVDVAPGFNAKRLADFGMALRERGIELLAGRVETADLVNRVREVGVDLAQGFALGAPSAVPIGQRCRQRSVAYGNSVQAASSRHGHP